MQELYTKFQAEYPLGDMTTATKMKDVFHELNEAIATIRLMQDCGNAEYERLYTDLEGNLNKLSDMATVIENSLTILLTDDEDAAWAAYNAASEIKKHAI